MDEEQPAPEIVVRSAQTGEIICVSRLDQNLRKPLWMSRDVSTADLAIQAYIDAVISADVDDLRFAKTALFSHKATAQAFVVLGQSAIYPTESKQAFLTHWAEYGAQLLSTAERPTRTSPVAKLDCPGRIPQSEPTGLESGAKTSHVACCELRPIRKPSWQDQVSIACGSMRTSTWSIGVSSLPKSSESRREPCEHPAKTPTLRRPSPL